MSKTIETRARLKGHETKTRASLRGVCITANVSKESYLTLTFVTAHGEDGARYEIAIRKLRAAPKLKAAPQAPKGKRRSKR